MTLVDEQPVVLITGISAAGKSTIADLLAHRFDRSVHVKGDVYRRMVVAGRHDMTSQPSDEAWSHLRLRYRLGAATADAYHEAGFSVVVQDMVIGSALADYVAAIHSRPLVVVVLTPRPDVVEGREAKRSKIAYREPFNSIRELDNALRRETPLIGMWLDNSDLEPHETVDEIIERGLDAGCVE